MRWRLRSRWKSGTIFPIVYLRRSGAIREHPLPAHPLHVYEDPSYTKEVESILR